MYNSLGSRFIQFAIHPAPHCISWSMTVCVTCLAVFRQASRRNCPHGCLFTPPFSRFSVALSPECHRGPSSTRWTCQCPPLDLPHAVSDTRRMYCLNRVKTKVQQRALAGEPRKSVWVTFRRLVRGTITFCLHPRALQLVFLLW